MHFRRAIRVLPQLGSSLERPSICYPLPHRVQGHGPIISIRGAKRRTTLNIDDLPKGIVQGALPPIAKLEVDHTEPERAYPTVLQQHLNNVRTYKDCIVLTRVGDFYEMYFDQVDQYAGQVGLKKAKRNTALGDVAMAGFQHTQLDRYLKMFVQDLGKQVAISEQIRLQEHERVNRTGAPMYDRKVTRIITPGTLVDETFITPLENNFLLAISITPDSEQSTAGLGWVDLSSGDFNVQSAKNTALPTLIARIGPREIVLDSSFQHGDTKHLQELLGEQAQAVTFHDRADCRYNDTSDWMSMLEDDAEVPKNLSAEEIAAGNMILDYVAHRLMSTNIKLRPPVRRSESEYMIIDKQSLRALEIKATLRDGVQQGSLLHTIRRTVTNSGARLLGQRIVSPSMSLEVINYRLDWVEELLHEPQLREDVTARLKDTSDSFRLLQKFSIGRGDADDMLGLARTIKITTQLAADLEQHEQDRRAREDARQPSEFGFMSDVTKRLTANSTGRLADDILNAIDETSLSRQQRMEIEKAEENEKLAEEVAAADEAGQEAPKLAKRMLKSASSAKSSQDEPDDIWIMRRGASKQLSDAHNKLDELAKEKHELMLQLRDRLGCASLTLKWTPQHGHFCHIKGKDAQRTVSTAHGVRSFNQTKTTQSLAVPDWTKLGQQIDDAKQRTRAEEERVFIRLKAHVFENLMKLRRNAAVLDELDVACSSAIVAKERNLVRPILNKSRVHNIIGGRHATVDVGLLNQGRRFTANDCVVGGKQLIHLITGPNMGGKSTYLRQNALITILAQTGCFVPADYAEIGLVDKIFSRVGSADNLYQDKSTFMVEMLETAEILKQATPRSFVIMDEIGRGTTPEDGIAVGYACLHHLTFVNQCRTLFATHFHALADMTMDLDKLARFCTDIAQTGEHSWIYAHKLKPGVNRKSHALKVARLADMPKEAIEVAAKVLADLQPAVSSPADERRSVDAVA